MFRDWLINDRFLKRLSSERIRQISERLVEWELDNAEFDLVLDSWFANFKWKDKELAYKILLNIDYFSLTRFTRFLHSLYGLIRRRIVELGLEGTALRIVTPEGGGDSAHRHAYDLVKTWALPREVVRSLPDLEEDDLSECILVLFNDTHGSGTQFIREVWPLISRLRQGPRHIFIASVALAAEARNLFKERLDSRVQVFPDGTTPSAKDLFTISELERISEIGASIYPKHPLGFGETALLTAYYFQCPNNSLPLIWADGRNNASDDSSKPYPWMPLFRYNPKIKRTAAEADERTWLLREIANLKAEASKSRGER